MVLIVAMSVLVSLSDLFSGDASLEQTVIITEKSMPIYKAILYSLIYPVAATQATYIVKYAHNSLKLGNNDYSMAYQFFYSWVFFILGLWQWLSHGVEFTW